MMILVFEKGNTWYFGYIAHIGVDRETELVHHVEVTGANVHIVTIVPELLTGKEAEVFGDSGYLVPTNASVSLSATG